MRHVQHGGLRLRSILLVAAVAMTSAACTATTDGLAGGQAPQSSSTAASTTEVSTETSTTSAAETSAEKAAAETTAERSDPDGFCGALDGLTFAQKKALIAARSEDEAGMVLAYVEVNCPEHAGAAQAAVDDMETTSAEPEPTYEAIETQTFTGSGDDVISLGEFTSPAILEFTCEYCDGNTVVETNGSESLLVNEIGSYSGSHFINYRDNSMMTRVMVTADADWTLVIRDITTAPDTLSGHGDQAIWIRGTEAEVVKITNDGDSNFVVQTFTDYIDLVVNEIGAYSGTVEMTLPALVQVESNGDWTLTPVE